MSNTDTTAVTAYPQFEPEPAPAQALPDPAAPPPSPGQSSSAPTDTPRRAARGTMPPLPGEFPGSDVAAAPPLPPPPASTPATSDTTRADARLPEDVRRAFDEDPHEMHTVPAPLVDADEIGLEELSEDDLEEIIEDDEDGAGDSFDFDIVEDAEAEPAAELAAAPAVESFAAALVDAPVALASDAAELAADAARSARPDRSIEHLEPSADSVEASSFLSSVAPVADVGKADDPPVVVREPDELREHLAAGVVETDAKIHAPVLPGAEQDIDAAIDSIIGPTEAVALAPAAAPIEVEAPAAAATDASSAAAEPQPRRITEPAAPRPTAATSAQQAEDPLLRSTIRPGRRAPSLADLAKAQNSIATLLPQRGDATQAAVDAPAPAPERRWLTQSESSRKEPLIAGAIVGAVAIAIVAFIVLSGGTEAPGNVKVPAAAEQAETPAAAAEPAVAAEPSTDEQAAAAAEPAEAAPEQATAATEEVPGDAAEAEAAPQTEGDDNGVAAATAEDGDADAADPTPDSPAPDEDGEEGAEAAVANADGDADPATDDDDSAGETAAGEPATRVVSTPLGEPPLAIAEPKETGPVRAVLASEPAGAVVTLLDNGEARVLGPSPVEVELDRSHRYEAVFTLDGHRSILSQVALGSNDAVEIRVNFKDRDVTDAE